MHAIVPLAEGVEEIEAVTIIDVLRRAEIKVTSVCLGKNPVTGSHGIKLFADKGIDDVAASEFDCIALPGGMPGSAMLRDDTRVIAMVRELSSRDKIVAAVCAAPIVLGRAGVLAGKRASCFPGNESLLAGAVIVPDPVVMDGKIITGRGPGCALPFALAVVELMSGKETAAGLKERMQVYWM
jgi:4-methyl-5(b-hydroxyethyl)-thiazole monophosphate biosynthesis